MKFLFKQKQDKTVADRSRIATRIAGFISRLQHKWVHTMERGSSKLSRKGQVFAFSLFLIAGSVYSFYCIARVFMEQPKAGLKMDQLRKPLMADKEQPAGIISDGEFLKIQHFKIYMDSLARSPGGKKFRDSLLHHHPGLMDSMATVEELYRRQHSRNQ